MLGTGLEYYEDITKVHLDKIVTHKKSFGSSAQFYSVDFAKKNND